MSTPEQKCTHCGATLPQDSLFCAQCGERKKPITVEQNVLQEVVPGNSTGAQLMREKMSDKIAAASKNDEPERTLWNGGYSPKAMLDGWILSLIITIIAIIAAYFVGGTTAWFLAFVVTIAAWGGHLVLLIYRKMSVGYELTSQRFIHKYGFFSRVTDRIEVIDIDDVQVAQSFVERFLGVGTIRVLSSDLSNPKLVMTGIDEVNRIATLIDDTRRTERRKRGLHIETV
jgi:membrane protein YdbS with pleckstrin-like domain